ncbi:unnamed protein product, partial [Vitrella brassicaformis CCMP3155]
GKSLYLQADLTHRIVHNETLLAVIQNEKARRRRFNGSEDAFHTHINNKFRGRRVMTSYVEFNESPATRFEDETGNESTSIAEYLFKMYGVQCQPNQPLVVSERRKKVTNSEGVREVVIRTIKLPVQCVTLTGLDETIRNDHLINDLVGKSCRMTPDDRLKRAHRFVEVLRDNPNSKAVLDRFKLEICDAKESVTGRNLNASANANSFRYYDRPNTLEMLQAPRGGAALRGDSLNFTPKGCLKPVKLEKWVVLADKADAIQAQRMARDISNSAHALGMEWEAPKWLINMSLTAALTPNTPDHQTLVEAISGAQCVVCLLPNSKGKTTSVTLLYNGLKQLLTCEGSQCACVAQCVQSKTLASNKWQTAAPKVVQQIVCKVGGAAWGLNVKGRKPLMAIGVDSRKSKDSTIVSLCATVDDLLIEHFTMSQVYSSEMDLAGALNNFIIRACETFEQRNNIGVRRVVIYRTGLGEGQKVAATEYEIPAIKTGLEHACGDKQPELAVILTTQQTNTRFATAKGNQLSNPPPLSVFDKGVADDQVYVWYGCHQQVTSGTITPTKYEVLHMDRWGLDVDQTINLTMQLSTMYQNWSGPIRVPAVVKMAEVCARKVAENLSCKTPTDHLATLPWYL